MVKEKKILLYFISFIFGLLATMIVGISGVFAQIIDYRFMNTTVENNFSISANSSLSANTYINVTGDSTRKYLVVDLCSTVGSGFSTEVTSNFDGSNTSFYKMYNLGESCTTNGGYIGATIRTYYLIKSWADSGNGNQAINNTTKFNNALSYSGIFELISVSLSDNVDTGDLSLNNQNIIINEIGSLNNSITNTEQNITNSITDTENNINQNIDNMESAIVDSNKETQEVIKDQFNNCRDSINLWGNLTWNIDTYAYFKLPKQNTLYTLSIKLKPGKTIPNNLYLGFTENGRYDATQRLYWLIQNGQLVNYKIKDNFYYLNNLYSLDYSFDYISVFPTSYANTLTDYFDIQLEEGNIFTSFEPYGEEICTNKLDEQNETLQGIQGALTDSSSPDISGLENSAGWLPAGPLDSILNLPLTMLNSLINSLGKTCTPLNLTLPYVNSQIQIPCLSTIFAQITGVNGLWTWVGTIASVLILYNYLLNLYAWVDRVLTLRAEFDEAMGADLANWGRL